MKLVRFVESVTKYLAELFPHNILLVNINA